MGGCNSGARTPIFCLSFFWRIFKMTKIFAIFRFFYFMISPLNRLFLAYLPKKIFPFKILWTCRFFSYNNFFSVQLTYKHPVAVFQSDRNLRSLFAPSDYAVFEIFIFFLQCSGSQWRHNFCDFPVFYFMISPPISSIIAKKIFPLLFLWTCKFLAKFLANFLTHFLTQGAYGPNPEKTIF